MVEKIFTSNGRSLERTLGTTTDAERDPSYPNGWGCKVTFTMNDGNGDLAGGTFTSSKNRVMEGNSRFENYIYAVKMESLSGSDGKFRACEKIIIYDEDEGCGDMTDAYEKTADSAGDLVSLTRSAAAAARCHRRRRRCHRRPPPRAHTPPLRSRAFAAAL